MSQIGNNVGKVAGQVSEQAVPILDQLIDKLTGRHASITYTFDNFKIDMPRAQAHGKQMMSGQVSIRGSITISAELHKKDGDTTHDNIGKGMKEKETGSSRTIGGGNSGGGSGDSDGTYSSSSYSRSDSILTPTPTPTTTMSTPTVGLISNSSSNSSVDPAGV
jgi:hypothetical protein